MQGPDGQPGYQHVLKLAKALLEARSLQGLSDKRVDELMALWQRLHEPDRRRVVYPPRHRERQLKGKNTSCPGKESLQRFSRQYRWDKDSPSITTSRRCRDLQGWVCLPHLATSPLLLPPPPPPPQTLLPDVPLMAASAAQPPPLRVPRTTAYRKRKAAEADAARGGPSPGSRQVSTPAASVARPRGSTLTTLALQVCLTVRLPVGKLAGGDEKTQKGPRGWGGMIALFSLILFYLYLFESLF
ncbi:uncharacterized protein LOC117477227 [Trematomus bernacchii]|uniref:uncharacterized protein LOC117477227 n=1 Tax=Trematomus bernacchii TaxID=40690 RepID=UPI00146C812A|nr:uncharacterized protein LOC117477227 [Trematomus bernacchii]